MKAGLSDYGRMVWALFYWNARKSAFVLCRRRGQCPCQNPSDSGRPMETGCEAVLGWRQPARFHRVCPLLARNASGAWVCQVGPDRVRPFWARALGFGAVALLVVVLLAGGTTFGVLRHLGYEVTLRQIFWPRAWRELRQAQAALFVRQAESHYAAGRTREAVAALETVMRIEPDNFSAGMLLAQIYQGGNGLTADRIYSRLLRSHPGHRAEIARAWFRGLLAQGRFEDVAGLARQELAAEPAAAAVWTNALIFSAQALHRPALVAAAATADQVPAPARAVLTLAAAVAQAPGAAERHRLVTQTPLVAGFPYDRVYRAEQLIADGFATEALGLLAVSTRELGGRDVARLALAAYANAGDGARLSREFGAFLAPERSVTAAELSLLALHLIQYPNATLLAQLLGAMDRVRSEPAGVRIETYLTIYCAAGVQKNAVGMQQASAQLAKVIDVSPNGIRQLESYFLASSTGRAVGSLPPALYPLSLECTYALLGRYMLR